MYKISREWIDKLFTCMSLYYGDRWTSQFKDNHELEFSKGLWASALYNLSYDDIKSAIIYARWHARTPTNKPPHQMEFYKWAKEKNTPFIEPERHKEETSNEIALYTLAEIKQKLGVPHRT